MKTSKNLDSVDDQIFINNSIIKHLSRVLKSTFFVVFDPHVQVSSETL